ncbi:hypothetical protein P175DRAFT_0530583 [Aspergillus ochraceoroseus IBT 24754]|uniref:Uncharacterized protein n=2 Tax=Aspergillus ochraceoroseus TaxID=138278 RepID=A0A2T5M4N7_9EURO|nr:uncharacterized protein P175DRAFT_0530583 [Aspergillus ochraceoroseus IBT 24754]KKK17501.1 hypothetical protein AOCH_003877 [Aspergillus ochraceoroseus]PTU23466.1 hypothetical protein P175DRAFT_0530583 [Aspergillus ochraceoroseus IBT 24754]
MTDIQISPEMLAPLRDKVVLITGSSSGIGKATVQLCLQLGAKVIAGDLNPIPEEITAQQQDQDQDRRSVFFFVKTDVTDWPSIRNLFVAGNAHFGRIDHVFANAGIGPRNTLLEETFDDDARELLSEPDLAVVKVNLVGMINTVRLAWYYLRRGRGSLVLAASASSVQNFGAGDYTIAKHGALGVIRGVGSDFAAGGVRLNGVAPSWTASGIVPREALTALGATVQDPEVVAKSVVMLFNDERRHGELIYSWEGKYREINKAERGLLDSAARILPTIEPSEEVMMERMKRWMAVSRTD